jgi:hypothetical protein
MKPGHSASRPLAGCADALELRDLIGRLGVLKMQQGGRSSDKPHTAPLKLSVDLEAEISGDSASSCPE